ncbi:MAG: hypothetical protein KDI55_00040 [Anaerolineae bacterium]|nr:hypothetical protein [Anaerolineae bacterium]
MTHVQNRPVARAYVRDLRRWSEDDQLAIVREYAERQGYELTTVRESEEGRAFWLRLIRNGAGHHVALLPSLQILAEPERTASRRPLVDYVVTLLDVMGTGSLIVDVSAGVTSADNGWLAAVEAAATATAQGRPLDRKRARRMAKRRWELTPIRGLVDEWRQPWNAEVFSEAKDVWCSTRYANDVEAWEAVNGLVERRGKAALLIGSAATARRIFESRLGKP